MEDLLIALSENVSEACFNDILDIVESILSEGEDLQKNADFYAQKIEHYTKGEGRKHPNARQIAKELDALHKLTLKRIEKKNAETVTKQPV